MATYLLNEGEPNSRSIKRGNGNKFDIKKGSYDGGYFPNSNRDWQLFSLVRLESFLGNEEALSSAPLTEETVAERDMKMRLFRKAIYSAFGDCIDLNVGLPAKTLLNLHKNRG